MDIIAEYMEHVKFRHRREYVASLFLVSIRLSADSPLFYRKQVLAPEFRNLIHLNLKDIIWARRLHYMARK